MWALFTGWLGKNAMVLVQWGLIALSVFGVLLGAKSAGRAAQKVDDLKKTAEVQRAQLQAANDRPRTRDDLTKRLLSGRY
jgi:hypothetical protein